jgi:hypothetical protein
MSAEFPTLESGRIHSYIYGQNNRSATYSQDDEFVMSENASPNYFLVEIEGLNKCDETAVGGNKSQFPDSFFAKIVTTGSTKAVGDDDRSKLFIEYNDHSGQENISKFSPPIGKLDRLRIRTRLHSQQGSQGFIYWTSDQAVATTTDEGTNTNIANYCLTFEIEYLDNGFDNFSSMSTSLRPSDRA